MTLSFWIKFSIFLKFLYILACRGKSILLCPRISSANKNCASAFFPDPIDIGKHEDIGYEYLKNIFKKEITEPIKYHVQAKRYLARKKKYFDLLSEASKTSLKLQGGALNPNECNKFESQEYFKSSILLRKFDEAAKRTDLKMKSINDYQKLLTSKLI